MGISMFSSSQSGVCSIEIVYLLVALCHIIVQGFSPVEARRDVIGLCHGSHRRRVRGQKACRPDQYVVPSRRTGESVVLSERSLIDLELVKS